MCISTILTFTLQIVISNSFCTPQGNQNRLATANLLSGPLILQAALSPYVGRRCLYLPTPDNKFTLEACLYRSLRFIDTENFSIFLGYFRAWAEEGEEQVQKYDSGQSWGCEGGVLRSASLHFLCRKDGGNEPAIVRWQEVKPCQYIAHLAFPEYCAV